MKPYIFHLLVILSSLNFLDIYGQRLPKVDHLNCVDYWSQVDFSEFCGLNLTDFALNTIPVDICNADQGATYRYEDLVSIRVYNHFSTGSALEEYGTEKIDASVEPGYFELADIGDDGYAVIQTQYGKLDSATLQVVVNHFTVYLEVNGAAHRGSNNCFNESSVIDFIRVLVAPLDEDE